MTHHIQISKYGRNQTYENDGWELLEVFIGADGKHYLVSEGGEVYDRIPDGNTKPIDTIQDLGEIINDDE